MPDLTFGACDLIFTELESGLAFIPKGIAMCRCCVITHRITPVSLYNLPYYTTVLQKIQSSYLEVFVAGKWGGGRGENDKFCKKFLTNSVNWHIIIDG